jgi:hypothetical protein
MDDQPGSGAAQVGILVGGALALLSSFLPWTTVDVSLAGGVGQGALGGRLARRLGRGILGGLLPGGGASRSVAGAGCPTAGRCSGSAWRSWSSARWG